jgi:hypothetical protein
MRAGHIARKRRTKLCISRLLVLLTSVFAHVATSMGAMNTQAIERRFTTPTQLADS